MNAIRFASKLPYIGKIGSPSARGYWTIWQRRGNGQPVPVKINQTYLDLVVYAAKFPLYDIDRSDAGDDVRVLPTFCRNCNIEWMQEIDSWADNYDLCHQCRMAIQSI
jgi:hypothetical protein